VIEDITLIFRNAKSLVKHLLEGDLTKRYGNLKKGVADIKFYLLFKDLDWGKRVLLKYPAPYLHKGEVKYVSL